MAEKKETIKFNQKELVEMLIEREALHEGHWGVMLEFGIGGGMLPFPLGGDNVVPAAIVPVLNIGIQRFDESTPYTVDAAEVNPKKKKSS